MSELHPDLVTLAVIVKKLNILLSDPEPGFYTWNAFLHERLLELATWLKEHDIKPVIS